MVAFSKRWGVLGAFGIVAAGTALVTVRARAADEPKSPAPARVAAVRHIMAGVHAPHCGALGELLKGEGPKNDKAWSDLATHAALLNESGHLLMDNGRCPDKTWAEATAALRQGTAGLFDAAGRKDLKTAQDSFAMVTASCQSCHAKHKGKPAAVVPAAAAAGPPPTPVPPASASAPRVATVRHLMSGINAPNCSALGDALKNDGPRDDKAWLELIRFASLLNEAGFLLTDNKRCPDDLWLNAATALREQSARVARAGDNKNLEEARNSFKGLTAACAACHQAHKKPAS